MTAPNLSITSAGPLHNLSATDRLRAMLDERGVEWGEPVGPFPQTAYAVGDVVWQAKELVAGLDLSTRYLTPEQAIAATLGPGTCKVVYTHRYDYEGGYAGTEYKHGLSCGHKTTWGDDDPPDFCPWCGAKVVD